MKKITPGVMFLLCFAAGLYGASENVILISWDGAQRLHVMEMLEAGKLPALKALKDSGSFVEIKVEGHATCTSAGHAQMLTGLTPEQNNVFSNSMFLPIPEGCTVGERLETALGTEKIFTAMIMGKDNYMGGMKYKPYYNARKNIDLWDGDKGRRDTATVGQLGLDCLEKVMEKRFFLFLHFIDPDTNGHGFGENSPQYETALVTCDTWLGKLTDKLKELKLYGKTTVFVTADHGFDEDKKDHSNAPDIFLAGNDKEVKGKGTQADITPTVLKEFGVEVKGLEPALAGAPLN